MTPLTAGNARLLDLRIWMAFRAIQAGALRHTDYLVPYTSRLGVLTVRFTFRGNVVRIFGAGYWRRGKTIYERENQIHE